MLTKFLLAVLNGVIVFMVLLIIGVILSMVKLEPIGAIISAFAWTLAILVGVLTFLGAIPSLWNNNLIK